MEFSMPAKRKKRQIGGFDLPFIMNCIIVGALITFGIQYKLLTYIALLWSCLIILRSSPQQILGFLLFVLSFAAVFKLAPSGRTFYNLLIVLSIAKLSSRRGMRLHLNQVFPVLLFAIYCMVFAGQTSRAVVDILTMSAYLLFLLLIFQRNMEYDLVSLLFLFSLGIILSSLASMLDAYLPSLESYIRGGTIRLAKGQYVDRFHGMQNNSNFYTLSIILALGGWAPVIMAKKGGVLSFVFAIALSVFGMMSISKSFLVAFLLLIGLILFNYVKNDMSKIIPVLAALAAGAVIIYLVLDNAVLQAYYVRLMQDSEADFTLANVTTGRSELWKLYATHIFGNVRVLFLGEGIDAGLLSRVASHNYFLEVLYHLGLIGATIYAYCIVVAVPKQLRSFKRNFLNYIPLAVLLVRAVAINLFFRENLFFYLILVIITLNTDFSEPPKPKAAKTLPNRPTMPFIPPAETQTTKKDGPQLDSIS